MEDTVLKWDGILLEKCVRLPGTDEVITEQQISREHVCFDEFAVLSVFALRCEIG